MRDGQLHVLHVVDRDTGGVPDAVAGYIRLRLADVQHFILSSGNQSSSEYWQGVGAVAHRQLRRGIVHQIVDVRRALREFKPDIIHAHSSFPGTVVRLAVSPKLVRSVYTPHCYSFERLDVSRVARGVFRLIERSLTWRTGVVAACSLGEARLARELGVRDVVYVPNAVSDSAVHRPAQQVGTLTVGSVGRLCAQKDPSEFAVVVKQIQREVGHVKAVWIGSGEAEFETQLVDDGVTVTGWVSNSGVDSLLADLDLYVHTAAWEGFPLAVLKAHESDLPMLVKRIRAFAEAPSELTIDDGLSELILALQSGSFIEWSRVNRSAWRRYLSDNTLTVQRSRLLSAYRGQEPSNCEP